jgi:hypothetical protein
MRYAQKKQIENTYIVRERDRRRSRELLGVLAVGVPLGLFLWLFTWQNLEVFRLGREATRLQEVKTDLQQTNKRLRLEVERLTALDEVEQKAARIGLQPVEPSRVVEVTVNGGPAAPAADSSR